MLQNKGKKLALALILVSVVTVGGYAGARALDIAPSTLQQEKSEQQKAFEEHLSQKEAKFAREYNEVKLQNDEIRRKFDSLPKSSKEEVIAANAQSLNKSNRK